MKISASSHSRQSGANAWMVCLLAGMFFFYEFIQMEILNSIVPQIQSALSINATKLGLISICYNIAAIIMLIPIGLIIDRFSLRRVILITWAISIIGTFTFAKSHTFEMACFARFVSGFGGSFAFLSCVKLASKWFPPNRMSFLTGVFTTMAMLGGILAQTPVVILTNLMNWSSIVYILVGLGVFLWGINFLTLKDPSFNRNKEPQQTKVAQDQRNLPIKDSMRFSLKNMQNWLCSIYASSLNLPIAILGSLWGIIYLTKTTQLTSIEAGNNIIIMFIGIMIGSPLIGLISDKLGRRKLPMIICALLSWFLIVAIITIPIASAYWYFVLFLLLGIVSSGRIISYPTIAESNRREYAGSAMAICSLLVMSGSFLRPLFGRIVDNHTSLYKTHEMLSAAGLKIAILIIPIAFVIALICSFFVKETYCKQLS